MLQQKVIKLSVSELFRAGRKLLKHFCLGHSFTKCNMTAKRIYLLEKRGLILADWFIHQML